MLRCEVACCIVHLISSLLLLAFAEVAGENDKTYRIVISEDVPYTIYDAKTDTWRGYCLDLLKEIAKVAPFDYKIIGLSPTMGHGKDVGDPGNWTGVLKELREDRADITLNPIVVMDARTETFDFTEPISELMGIGILIRKPQQANGIWLFFDVMETEVWLIIAVAFFCASILLWLCERFSPYSYRNTLKKGIDDGRKRRQFIKHGECIWFCMTSLIPEGGGEAPRNMSGKIIGTFWWFFGFILIASYSANLSAFLTIDKFERKIDSLDDLINQNEYSYAPLYNSLEYKYFVQMQEIEKTFYRIWRDISLNDSLTLKEKEKVSTWEYPLSSKYMKLFRTMKQTTFPNSMEEVVERIRAGNRTHKFAFLGGTTEIDYLATIHCDLKVVDYEFSKKSIAFALRKGLPIKRKLDSVLRELRTSKVFVQLRQKWWNNSLCSDDDDENLSNITLKTIGGLFIVFAVGVSMSYIALGVEYLVHSRYHKFASSDQSGPKTPPKSPKLVEPVATISHPRLS